MKKLDNILRNVDPIEQQQLITGKNINDLPVDIQSIQNKQIIPQMPQTLFSTHNIIEVRKHHRFSTMQPHKHDFVELNYVYSGTCVQYINKEKIILPQFSLVMLDKDIVHSIDYMGENDILVNILFKTDNQLLSILDSISNSQNIITKFLYNSSKLTSIHSNFIVFDLKDNEYAINLLHCIILKGLSPFSDNLAIQKLYSLLLPELTNCIEKEVLNFKFSANDNILQILKFIDDNFKNVTLQKTAQHFGYNPNYLGSLIKEETHYSFQELIDNKKLSIAKKLLVNSNYSLNTIAELVGYNSVQSLIRLFKRKLNLTPSAYKKSGPLSNQNDK